MSEPQAINQIPAGHRARLVQVLGGHKLNRRLLALGLNLGAELEVVQHRGRGIVVARGGMRIALGEGVAEKLLVEVLD